MALDTDTLSMFHNNALMAARDQFVESDSPEHWHPEPDESLIGWFEMWNEKDIGILGLNAEEGREAVLASVEMYKRILASWRKAGKKSRNLPRR